MLNLLEAQLQTLEWFYKIDSKNCTRDTQNRPKMVFKTNYPLMQVNNIAECSNSAIPLTFIKVPFVIKIFVLSILSDAGFSVY